MGGTKKKCRCICFDQIWPEGRIRKIFITWALGKVGSTNSVEGVEGAVGRGLGPRCHLQSLGPTK